MDIVKNGTKVLPEDVREILRFRFTKAERTKGQKFTDQGAIAKLEVVNGALVGRVFDWAAYGKSKSEYYFDTQLIFIEDDELFFTFKGNCSCNNKLKCAHAAALLYHLLESGYDKFQPPFNKLIAFQAKEIPLIEAMLKKAIVPASTIKPTSNDLTRAKASEYRELPIIEGSLSKSQMKFAKFDARSSGRWYPSKKILLPTNEVLLISGRQFHAASDKESKVKLKYENGKLWIKCLSCSEYTSKLCDHQYFLLEEGTKILKTHGLLSGKLDYSNYEQRFSEKMNIDSKVFQKYYSILLLKKEIGLEAKVENLRTADWVKKTIDFIGKEKQENRILAEEIEANLLEGRSIKYAYLWVDDVEDDSESMLKFLKGKSLKKKEGLHSSERELLHFPNEMPEDQRELATKLFIQAAEQNRKKRFELLKRTIEENIEQLNEAYHYVKADYNYYTSGGRGKSNFVKFSGHTIKANFYFTKVDGMVNARYELTVGGEPFDYDEVVFSNGIFSATKNIAHLLPSPELEAFLELFQSNKSLIVPFTNEEDFSKLLSGFKNHFEVEIEVGIQKEEIVLDNGEFTILLREVGEFVIFEPRIKFGDFSFNAFDEDSYIVNGNLSRVKDSDREFLIGFLKGLHPSFDNAIQAQDYVFLQIKELANNNWFYEFGEACDDAGVKILGQKELSKFKLSRHRPNVYSHVKSGIDWFEVDTGVSFGKYQVPTADWIRAIRNSESFVELKDGSLGVLPEEWLEKAKQLLAVAEFEDGELRISKYRYNVIEELFKEVDDEELFAEIRAKKKKLAEYNTNKKYKVSRKIKAKLRKYQKDGFAWLNFLHDSSFGGILADDMGLGKTIQVIAFLASLKDKGTHLVIVPRSLLFNWAAELEKFCPSLKFIIHHGQSRTKNLDDYSKIDIIITTYDTAVNDMESFKDFNFNYIVLDESQAIKNPNSKRYKALRLLQSYNKIAMTGTPIENNTMDLFAQLSFTSPGLLGSASHFKNSFAIPIDNKGDVDAANLLRKLTHPFILRRTKEQVAKDLPEKTETVIYCEMGPAQRKLYDNLKRKIKEDLEEEIEEKGFAKARFKMLDGLLRLRQMCNSPLLINKSFKGANANSVKIDILIQNITEELDQHKALVFSQFTSLLAVVRSQLDALGIKYCYLDGSTRKRQSEVDRFQNNPEIKIFLISIKAGNTGLNLTEADYVYILDPWWNPAVEAQAIDRTHRIGQTKHVFAYKLICKNSIEEKILMLQEKKKKLADDIIRTDESVFKALNKKSLMSLLD